MTEDPVTSSPASFPLILAVPGNADTGSRSGRPKIKVILYNLSRMISKSLFLPH
jgi:hypothetical protein